MPDWNHWWLINKSVECSQLIDATSTRQRSKPTVKQNNNSNRLPRSFNPLAFFNSQGRHNCVSWLNTVPVFQPTKAGIQVTCINMSTSHLRSTLSLSQFLGWARDRGNQQSLPISMTWICCHCWKAKQLITKENFTQWTKVKHWVQRQIRLLPDSSFANSNIDSG